jgi:hypothetical protein
MLAPLANKSQKDIRAFIRMAETSAPGEGTFEASYSAPEIEEILAVMKRLVMIREVVLKVNLEYIHSAAQADEFRTEPPFRLQGSYRNMNRLAEKVVPIMNEQEVRALVVDHYRSESQTLTTGAEANLLKFKELIGAQSAEEKARWKEIQQTFKRNQVTRGADPGDPMGRVVAQLASFQQGVEGIQAALEKQSTREPAPMVVDLAPIGRSVESLRGALEQLARPAPAPAVPDANPIAAQLGEGLRALREDLGRAITAVHSGSMAEKVESLSHELEMIHSTLATLKDLAAQQRDHLRTAQELLAVRAKQGTVEIELTQEMMTNERAFLDHFHHVIDEAHRKQEAPPENNPPPPTQ